VSSGSISRFILVVEPSDSESNKKNRDRRGYADIEFQHFSLMK
jgi:hypothetical protein